LTGALHIFYLQLAPPLPSFLTSIKTANPGSPGKMAIKTEREREREAYDSVIMNINHHYFKMLGCR